MKANHTEVIFIIDSSGSMAGKESDITGGFKTFIDEQKKIPGTCSVTVVNFNTNHKILFENKDINEVPKLEYKPDGLTALHDTCGAIINHVGKRYQNTPENERPENVIVVIMTDGFNNINRKYNAGSVQKMIETQTNIYSWQFIYMGAHADAWDVGYQLGITNTVQTDSNFQRSFGAGGQAVANYRRTKSFIKHGSKTLQDDYEDAS